MFYGPHGRSPLVCHQHLGPYSPFLSVFGCLTDFIPCHVHLMADVMSVSLHNYDPYDISLFSVGGALLIHLSFSISLNMSKPAASSFLDYEFKQCLISSLAAPRTLYVLTLFVCLLAGLCQNYSTDFHKIRRKGGTLAIEEPKRLW